MSWNFRVLVKEHNNELYFDVHEVYYKNGIPDSYTKNPITIGSEDIEGLKWMINKINEGLNKPFLWSGEKFPQEYTSI